ncbi:MAG TPA: PorP/SprF family type IX secretion system membrane protein [Pedobacter sp.]|jgi:type IX secretion system PorP/SprF family membrane protein
MKSLKRYIFSSFCLLSILFPEITKAQLNPLSSIYYTNQYLANPAMAGVNKGLNLNLGYRQQWSAMPGAPKTQALSLDYGTEKKVGLGLTVFNDQAGLLKNTRVMGTYSYHLTLNEKSQLRFGISLGFMDERIMTENLSGDADDMNVSNFNQRETYLDGDFGTAYTSDKFTFQLAVPNLKSVLKKDEFSTSDYSTFYSALSYKFFFSTTMKGMIVEPKVAIRGVHGFTNLLDFGANVAFANNSINIIAMYHNSKSATMGLGATIKSIGTISGNYTTATAALSSYMKGNFEFGWKTSFNKRKTNDKSD